VKQRVMLTTTSLLSVLFLSLHFTSDFIHNQGELSLQGLFITALILVVILVGTLVLAERRSGHLLMLLGSLGALGMPVLHLWREGAAARAMVRPDAFIFVWALVCLAVTGIFGAILSVNGLVGLMRARPRDTHGAG
jgi:hypothetical protein